MNMSTTGNPGGRVEVGGKEVTSLDGTPEFGRGVSQRGEGRDRVSGAGSGTRHEGGARALREVFFQARTRPGPRGRASSRPPWGPPP